MTTPRNLSILAFYLAAIATVPAAEPLAEWTLKLEFPDDIVRIQYNPALAEPVNKTFDPGAGWDMHEVIATKLAPDSDEVFLIIFDPGPSADPNFQVVRGTEPTDDAYLGSMNGLTLTIPGDGFLYVSGHTNTTFDRRSKYRVTDDGLEEVPQPYYYVGLSTATLKPVTLRSALEGGETVAELPAGTEVEILLNRDDDYLIKAPEGLVGWFTEKLSTQDPDHFEGLYFRGD
ncbi:MAG: hypothetical protein KJ060_00940 [Candidatus Hydrogenedentes bacterium]|nr:hypothetical protein [Candidatus Hydrogenedentota bacterium]